MRTHPSTIRALAALTLLSTLPFLPTRASAQPSWRPHADLSRLREGTDSFTVFVRGAPFGWQRLSWAREGSPQSASLVLGAWNRAGATTGEPAWIMADETTLTGIQQRSEVRFTASAVELGLRQTGLARGAAMRITLDRVNGKMKGEALTPSGGASAVPMDVAVSDDVIDDNALTGILPAIKWSEGLTFELPVLASGKGTIDTFRVSVTGKGATTVPAGTFETWRITLAGAQYALLAEVTTTAPYRVVRLTPRGSPMDIQLVK